MALLMFHGFDEIQTGTPSDDLSNSNVGAGVFNGWGTLTAGGAASKQAGQLGGGQLVENGFARPIGWLAASPSGASPTWIFGLRTSTPNATRNVMTFLDSANAIQCGLDVNASSKLIFWRGTNATVLGTGTTTIVNGAYYYIEVKVLLGTGTSGAFEVRINGVADIGPTASVNTQNTGNNNFQGVRGQNYKTNWDDVYLLDTTGGAPLNSFLGIVRVETLFVTTNDSVAFTPLSSTNASQVSETNSDNDTTYNSATASAVDTFNHGSLASTPSTIYAAKTVMKVRVDDVALINTRTKLKSGATTANGTTVTPPTTYQYYEDMYLTDPNTGVAWTGTNINATKIGYERI